MHADLEVEELVVVLKWFESNVPGDDMIFETIWAVDAETGAKQQEPPTAAALLAVPEEEKPDEAATAEAGDGVKPDDFEAFKARAVAFLRSILSMDAEEGVGGGEAAVKVRASEKRPEGLGFFKEYKLDQPRFKKWLLALAGHLTTETFTQTMAKLSIVASRHNTAKNIFTLWDADESGRLEFAEVSCLA